jgi:hypothetical protein
MIPQKSEISNKLILMLIAVSMLGMISLTNQVYASSQFARPDADIETSGWIPHPLFSRINEMVADTTSVRSIINPHGEDFTVSLSDVIDPLSPTGHIVRYVYDKDLGEDHRSKIINLTVYLKQGSVIIASKTHFDISGDPTPGSFTLTTSEADQITDYSDLRLTFTATAGAGSGERLAKIKWAELEVPAVLPPVDPKDESIVDHPVAGELLSVDYTALLFVGFTSSAIWMVPILVGFTGVGIYYVRKHNKEN